MPQFMVEWKVSERYISVVSFIIVAFLVLKLYILKGFRSSRKLDFWLLLSGFSRITPPNEVGFVQKFHQWCIARKRITYITVFHKMLKIPKNSAQNLNFWLIFWKLFDYTLLRPFIYTPMFMPNQRSHGDVQSCQVSSLQHFWLWS